MIRYLLSVVALIFLPLAVNSAAASPAIYGSYWGGFKKYWSDLVASRDGVAMVALLVAAVALFIITRGKWIK